MISVLHACLLMKRVFLVLDSSHLGDMNQLDIYEKKVDVVMNIAHITNIMEI